MQTEEIQNLFTQFECIVCDYQGVECWSARELQKLLGYAKWQTFSVSIEKAKVACKQAGQDVGHHFTGASKMVELGSGSVREIDDYLLTRYACYLIAQNHAVADFLPTVSITAKKLAAEMTSVNVQSKDLYGQQPIENEHVENNKAVREMLVGRGIVPEQLPPAEDIKKVEKRLKKDDKHNTKALITKDKEYEIDKNSDLFHYLERMQDEVHNFTINYHRQLRNKGSLSSLLDNIDGIGKKRKIELLKKFKNITEMKNKSIEELEEVVPHKVALELYEFLKER